MTGPKRLEDDPPAGTAISDVGGEAELIERLSAAQRTKLEANRGKRHWLDAEVTDGYLWGRLLDEVDELQRAVEGGYGDPWLEAADVANFAAFLADRGQRRQDGAA